MESEVGPAEVYARVGELIDLCRFGIKVLYGLSALVVLQIIYKRWETLRVTRHLDMAARHGEVTDSQVRRMEAGLAESTAVLTDVRELLTHLEGKADTAAQAARSAAGASEELRTIVARVEHQTNSLTAKAVESAGREGVTEGRKQMGEEAADRGDVRGEGTGEGRGEGTGPTLRETVDEVAADVKEIKDVVKPNGESDR